MPVRDGPLRRPQSAHSPGLGFGRRESNSLIVSGSRSDLQDAQAIIERLDGEGVEKAGP